MPKLSLVVPAYNEENLIEPLIKTVHDCLNPANIDYELLIINDGSSDNTWNNLMVARKSHPEVRGISFSRNFGKEAAIFAGLQYAQGECVAIMDADLQHPPETLVQMYHLWEQGYEVIDGVKANRGKESVFYKTAAKTFYKILSMSTGVDMSTSSDFKLMDKKVVNTLIELDERHLFFRGLSAWVGYKTTQVEFNVAERAAGVTKWNKLSLLRYAVRNISSFSTLPLQFVSFMGGFFVVFSLIIGVQSLYKYFSGHALGGFTTVILLVLITGAIIMLSLGILGGYLARIYEEVKRRPRFIVSNTELENQEPCTKN